VPAAFYFCLTASFLELLRLDWIYQYFSKLLGIVETRVFTSPLPFLLSKKPENHGALEYQRTINVLGHNALKTETVGME